MKFEKGVPLPVMPVSRVKVLQSMQIGDSMLVAAKEAVNWRQAMHKASERGEFYFISRTVEGGVRIWRKA